MTKTEIQMVRSLHQKGGRTEHGLFIAQGEKIIEEILESSLVIRKIYALNNCSLCTKVGVESISPKEMERISTLTTANNSLAVVEIPQYSLEVESLKSGLTLMLDEVQNPGNLGTIIRLADWFGIKNIICSPTSADLYNPKVVQATMGAILRVRVSYTPLTPILERLKALDIPIYGTDLSGDNIYHTDLDTSGVIVMGNEGRGMSKEVSQHISKQLYIPPYPCDTPSSESLNVAIATAIVCSEFRRRV